MRTTFATVDDGLIERCFQPISDLIVSRAGLSRTGVACFSIDIAALSWIVSRAGGLSDAGAAWNILAAMPDLAYLLLGLVAMI